MRNLNEKELKKQDVAVKGIEKEKKMQEHDAGFG
jgi:hypothetical protein